MNAAPKQFYFAATQAQDMPELALRFCTGPADHDVEPVPPNALMDIEEEGVSITAPVCRVVPLTAVEDISLVFFQVVSTGLDNLARFQGTEQAQRVFLICCWIACACLAKLVSLGGAGVILFLFLFCLLFVLFLVGVGWLVGWWVGWFGS